MNAVMPSPLDLPGLFHVHFSSPPYAWLPPNPAPCFPRGGSLGPGAHTLFRGSSSSLPVRAFFTPFRTRLLPLLLLLTSLFYLGG
ncbi:hypothetical protein LX32DRAFT_642614 [Colletotrichum zoysiae]|uniref:Uncharacterized protein n=1 Tax=Colletotrichum zoysiae TaxID=1216348 RepID=A0AAD9HAR1_9PEZI|nr:hypothetical protein LX32DRAFT_642614 [Colletotrichum zoysiae]